MKFRAEMVEGHFGDGSKFGVQITYLREEEPLGTAGSLGLLPAAPTEPVFVMNGDLLTRINLVEMLAFHREHRASATMAVRKFEMQVPYGVVEVADNFIRSIQEKPTQCFFVNGGIYVLDPGVIATEIPKNRYQDIRRCSPPWWRRAGSPRPSLCMSTGWTSASGRTSTRPTATIFPISAPPATRTGRRAGMRGRMVRGGETRG